MKKFLHLSFIPRSTDLALLVLRVVCGGGMLWLHGRGKLMNFGEVSGKFADPFGIGQPASLALAVFAEVFCAGLLVLGAFTRLAAVFSAITMGVAFFVVHNAKLSGPGNGELAFMYLAGFVALFLAGAGRFSVDAQMGAKG